MHFLKTLIAAAIALAILVHGGPVPHGPAVNQLEHASMVAKRSTSGFNDWNCKPSSSHPRALVLVHGMSGNAIDNWLYMAPRFAAKGYCVFALSYGQLNRVPIVYGLDKIENSAQQLSDFIDKVLVATNTTQVDILGHSEGSFMPRYYLKRLGGASKVHKFAGIGAVNQGSTLRGLTLLLEPLGLYDPVLKIIDPLCHACLQLLKDSAFLKDLNAGGDTVPGVEYLTLVTKYDEVVTPYTSGFLLDKNPKVHNHVLQDWCVLDVSEHLLIAFDPVVFNGLHAFFTPSADQHITCADAIH
ncbi:hypothetical protein KVV02_002974 [Mortierella alpina]|uniref:Lipase n=1 Tax=Mortierella alpina TaxID=64518 RepID=A0A9P8CWX5_MORAP|nr:hypothetical protein KVV02_002974 [Mortierella alpina]